MNSYNIEFFKDAEDFVRLLPIKDQGKVFANINTMRINLNATETKILKAPIRESKVKKYRLLFFIEKNTIYITSGFIKKSQKTPLREIRKAEEIYKQFKTLT